MTNDFDVASNYYDKTFTYSKIGLAQRSVVYKNTTALFSTEKKLNILELNCGTGYDAINFAKKGHQIIATDISEGMINVAKSKNDLTNLEFKTQDINQITHKTFQKPFDVIFSNFGGLNCLSLEELDRFLKATPELLTKKGKLFLVIMPKKCLWERIYFTLKGDLKKAKRRLTDSFVTAYVDTIAVKTWYYNPQDIINSCAIHYNVNNIKPIGLCIPPSYLENSWLTTKGPLSLFKGLDNMLTHKRFAKYADHFLIELELK